MRQMLNLGNNIANRHSTLVSVHRTREESPNADLGEWVGSVRRCGCRDVRSGSLQRIGVRGLVGETVTPVIRVTAVVLEREDAKVVGQNAVVDGVWKARHEVMPYICFNNAPSLGSILNDPDGSVSGVEKLRAKCGNSPLVELSRLDEFRFGIGVVNQAHPMARRAACMTSS